jgi:hypothetical protein
MCRHERGFHRQLAHAYFDIVAVVGGVVMTSVIIGSASSALQSLDAETEARRQRMDKVSHVWQKRDINRRAHCEHYNDAAYK